MKKKENLLTGLVINPNCIGSWVGCWKLNMMNPIIREGAYADHYGLFVKNSQKQGITAARHYVMIHEYSIMAVVTSIFEAITVLKNKRLAYDVSSDHWAAIIQPLQTLSKEEIKESLVHLNGCDEEAPIYGFSDASKNQRFHAIDVLTFRFDTISIFEVFCKLTGFDVSDFWMAVDIYKIICSFVISGSASSDGMISKVMRSMIDVYITNTIVAVNDSINEGC